MINEERLLRLRFIDGLLHNNFALHDYNGIIKLSSSLVLCLAPGIQSSVQTSFLLFVGTGIGAGNSLEKLGARILAPDRPSIRQEVTFAASSQVFQRVEFE